ncbi:MAG TPA: DUF4190 domain-containing protein [Acidimicrobiales bacterium]|nr:DUF4190 domain-containing protein [Acidimicrobiales bacterium]
MTTPPPPPPPGPYGYGAAPRDHPQGTTILVLGILSLLICSPLGLVAWIMANNALAEIDRDPGAYSNRGMIAAGRICGIIATVFLVLGFFAAFLLFGST